MQSKLIEVFEEHVVSVAEAAYNTLFGIWLPRNPGVALWTAAINFRIDPEEWQLDWMECHLSDATGLNHHGRLIFLMAPHSMGVGPGLLPADRLQNMGNRVCLHRPVQVTQGVGLYIRTPSLVATDVISTRFAYRRMQ
jgi:hypothetical protein